MDPNTQLIVSSVVSGAAGAFVQQTLTSGGAWLKERFAGHQPAAMQQATANVNDFLNELGARVQRMEESNLALRERIVTAMEHPDYSIVMQRAVLAAAQTNEHDKHVLLAQLVSERLRVDEDTTLARACQLACDAVSNLTSRQLKILGFLYTLDHLASAYPSVPTLTAEASEAAKLMAVDWAVAVFSPYRDITCSSLDVRHLLSVGCLATESSLPASTLGGNRYAMPPELNWQMITMIGSSFDYLRFAATPAGANAKRLFEEQGLRGFALTSMGSLIGMFVADQLASRPTDVTTWEG